METTMKTGDFIEGLNIILPFYTKGRDGYNLGADHDVIYIYATDNPLPETDVKRLLDLGFFQPEVQTGSDYDPAEGWAVYV
jgi:hypothetical protein